MGACAAMDTALPDAAGAFVVLGSHAPADASAIAIEVAHRHAVTATRPVLVFSTGLSALQFTSRLVAGASGVDCGRLQAGRLEAEDWRRLAPLALALGDAPLYVEAWPWISLALLQARIDALAEQVGAPGVVVVDSLRTLAMPRHAARTALAALAARVPCTLVAVSDGVVQSASEAKSASRERSPRASVM